MKICITSQGSDLNSEVDSRFGRCAYFIIIDTDTMDYKAIENPNIHATGGAGIKSAQFVVNKDAKAVITGNCGPNAFHTLKSANIDVITGVKGEVKEVLEKYKEGSIEPINNPNVSSRFGF